MEHSIIIVVGLGLLGLVLGSFAGATVWRLRMKQLAEDAEAGEKIPANDKKEIGKLKPSKALKDRSVCLHCGHTLRWYDLIPLFSWVSLKGKCRYCHKRIGLFEPLIEVGVAFFFIASFVFWPYPFDSTLDIVRFVLWLVAGVGMAILAAYDLKWFLLPNRIVFPVISVGLLYSFVAWWQQSFAIEQLMSIFYACVTLSGLYYLIYVASRHMWVGFGDVKLGLALALLLADWQLAVLALFAANFIGTLIVLPLMISGKVTRQARIPFGPLLILGWLIAGIFGQAIIANYLRFTLGY